MDVYTHMPVVFYSFATLLASQFQLTCICDMEGMEEAEATLEKSKS